MNRKIEVFNLVGKDKRIFEEWCKLNNYRLVNVMRPSLLGNPFKLVNGMRRDEVIAKFKKYLWNHMKAKTPVGKAVYELAAYEGNIALGCCCAPKACHADVIKKAIEWVRNN